MPLPPALAAKLAKRGLLANSKSKSSNQSTPNPPGFVEEVIAESYDDPKTTSAPKKTSEREKNKENVSKLARLGHPGCPNKCNVFHTCSGYCIKYWGVGKATPEPKYDLRRRKMLKKYPLPSGWIEVFDPGMGRYYYWDTANDDVCWHSPTHPKAKVGKAASDQRLKLLAEGDKSSESLLSGSGSLGSRPMIVDNDRERLERDRDRDRDRDKERSYRDRDAHFKKPDHRDRRRRNRDDDELDPMDPSSYSDVPRGTWSSGLLPEGAKTGVDTTASGSLFQQRPLPSPGAVLRANAEKTGKK